MFDELLDRLFSGELRETRNMEFKRSYTWSNPQHRHKIVKTALALANVRDGGYLIFGIEDHGGVFEPVGMSEDDYNMLDGDDILAEVNNFADPFVDLQLVKKDRDGMKFAFLRVFEFAEIPVICKRQGEVNLRPGVVYTRATRIPESVPVPSQTEMREIIELAVDKGIRHFEARQQRQFAAQQVIEQVSIVNDNEKFDEELEGL